MAVSDCIVAWRSHSDTYLSGYSSPQIFESDLAVAQAKCIEAGTGCGGITLEPEGGTGGRPAGGIKWKVPGVV